MGICFRIAQRPQAIRRGLERMITLEREGAREGPVREAMAYTEKLAVVESKRSRYQDMAAEGLIAFNELRAKLANLQKTREAAERELED